MGKKSGTHGRPCRGDADGPAAASNEPLGHDGHRHHFAQRGHGQRAQPAEDQVEHPKVFDKLEQDEGAAEAERAHQHQEAGAVGLVLQGAQHRRKRSRGQRPHGERAVECGPRPAQVIAHVRHEDAGAPDARATRERPAHDGNGHNHPAVVKPRLASSLVVARQLARLSPSVSGTPTLCYWGVWGNCGSRNLWINARNQTTLHAFLACRSWLAMQQPRRAWALTAVGHRRVRPIGDGATGNMKEEKT